MPRTKKAAIAESFAAVGATKELDSLDLQGREATSRNLSPRQAYQLTIPFHRSVNVIVEQIVKCDRKLLTQNGDEITSGETYDFVHKNITKEFVRECLSNWFIEGEMFVLKPFSISSEQIMRPEGLLVLDSGFARPMPPHVRSLEFVTSWQYTNVYQISDKTTVLQIPADQVMYCKNFNPNNTGQGGLRGLSPALVGCQHINGSYFSARYNSSFFQNGAHSDLILKFPKGTSKKEAQSVTDYWVQRHKIFDNASFRVAAVIADEFEVVDPGQTAKDGNFLALADYDDKSVYSLLGVPPVISGDYSNATYDSADVQYESFFENTLLPAIEVFNDFIQTQLIEPHFSDGSIGANKKQIKLNKYLKKSVQEYIGADIIFRLDPESLPVASKLRLNKLTALTMARQSMALTFKQAAEYMDEERPSNAADDIIYVANTEQLVVTEDTTLPQNIVQVTEEEPEEEGESTEDEQKALRKVVIRYRSELLRQAATKSLNKKALINIVKDNKTLLMQLMIDFLEFQSLFKSEEPIISCKNYLNTTYSRKNLKTLSYGKTI